MLPCCVLFIGGPCMLVLCHTRTLRTLHCKSHSLLLVQGWALCSACMLPVHIVFLQSSSMYHTEKHDFTYSYSYFTYLFIIFIVFHSSISCKVYPQWWYLYPACFLIILPSRRIKLLFLMTTTILVFACSVHHGFMWPTFGYHVCDCKTLFWLLVWAECY